MKKIIVLFESTHAVIKTERLCRQEGIPCQAIPVPRALSSECGIALEIDESERTALQQLLDAHSIRAEMKGP